MSANGSELPTIPGYTPEQLAEASKAITAMDPEVQAIIANAVAGMVARGPQGMPPVVILNLIAWKTGNVLANSLQGDIATLAKFRKGFIEAFNEGVQKAPIVQAARMGGSALLRSS